MPKGEAVRLLDGGMGHELKLRRVHEGMDPSLETLAECFIPGALANRDRPEAVRQLHKDYIASGARAITTNNFILTPHSLSKVGFAAELSLLTQEAGKRAREAADASNVAVLVAGCIPPLWESYQTEGLGSQLEMEETYAQIVEALLPYVDVFLCETLASRAEAKAAIAAASSKGKPLWISWTLQDDSSGTLRNGESLKDAVEDVATTACVEALLLNCSSPEAITAGLSVLRGCAPESVLIGGYGNGFETTTSEWLAGGKNDVAAARTAEDFKGGIITEKAYAAHALQWVNLGANIVGGCCGVGPSHINAVADALAGR
mmetsp:Transcript_23412/g.64956  ORF Transcript_23412/g.64956 Transcript_23412/m.64956 type:complete len:318 (+) Transcript_23412:108-1061(+)